MKLSLKIAQPEKFSKACLLMGVYADGKLSPAAKDLDKTSKGFISKLVKQGAIEGKLGQALPIFHVPNTKNEHIILIGCGSVNDITSARYKKILSNTMKAIKQSNTTQAVSYMAEVKVVGRTLPWNVKQHAEVAGESIYCFDLFKTD